MAVNKFTENLTFNIDDFIELKDGYFDSISTDTINKGMQVFKKTGSSIIVSEIGKDTFTLRVPSSDNNKSYTVTLDAIIAHNYPMTEDNYISDHCTCPAFEKKFECKHAVAGVLFLEKNILGYDDDENINSTIDNPILQKNSTNKKILVGKSVMDLDNIVRNLYPRNFFSAVEKNKLVAFVKNEETRVYTATFKQSAKDNFDITILYDGDKTLAYNCTCGEDTRNACMHEAILLLYILADNKRHWKSMYSFTKERADMAVKYNLKPDSELLQQFKFSYDIYRNELSVITPKNLITNENALLQFSKHLVQQKTNTDFIQFAKADLPEGIALLLNFYKPSDYADFELLALEMKSNKDFVLMPLISKQVSTNFLKENHLLPENIIATIKDLSLAEIVEYARENPSLPKLYDYGRPFAYYDNASFNRLRNYSTNVLLKNWQNFAQHPHWYYRPMSAHSTPLQKISLGTVPYALQLNVLQNEETTELQLQAKIMVDDKIVIIEAPQIQDGFAFYDGVMYPPLHVEDYELTKQFKGESKIFLSVFANKIKEQIIHPFLIQHDVIINGEPFGAAITINEKPSARVMFKEAQENFLLLQPQFIYGDCIIEENNNNPIERVIDGDNIFVINRQLAIEQEARLQLSTLHPLFGSQLQEQAFYLSYAEAMKDAWFVKAITQLKDLGFDSYSTDSLKTFKLNPHTPTWKMKTSSGIDWFDLQIEISFGDEEVALSEIRKALLSGQNILKLKDGSIGMIPKEWREKFGTLLKMGSVQKNGELQISKLHFTIIDALHDEISEKKILQELAEKKNKLFNIDKVKTKAVSKNIKATLRHYQEHGLQWMQTLDELGWGGCLADDMGLGKTLQTIAFLQYVKEKYKTATSLVVCPTSLIYNWEAELQKFAPKLKYHIHYGGDRNFDAKAFAKYDIIIASYGMVRSDIELCKTMDWHYVILDESQAIKNPTAQISKAVQLLPAKNKLILSGTPLQNNTFDLYAQFQFINPGLLGNQDFFREEFSTPIDKNNDADKSKLLRQLVYPFLLRRTKEQVATDLPAKIESTIWCEMDKKQRKVYNEYKDHYRKLVLEKIDEVGMSKAGIYVIEGLLRLRQICDSPVLVKNEKVTTTESVKIKELVRELTENTGTNKVLVFSQFTSMLGLIKEALEKEGIQYSYLDGGTKAEKRKEAVDTFQTNENIKVFLISLKAGGVGLNLTSANYVYLIDPWWNPAVEQQAIDRTHRIGQKNKIFAYKMICKDTVEEKIIALQQRKKQLANDLITEDAGFLKKITREDVQFLFS
jgi:SNF2-related domain/Helicase conserved C-terminal domain